MTKEQKITMLKDILVAVIKSPAIGNLPGNREEISANIRKTFDDVKAHFAETIRGIKD